MLQPVSVTNPDINFPVTIFSRATCPPEFQKATQYPLYRSAVFRYRGANGGGGVEWWGLVEGDAG